MDRTKVEKDVIRKADFTVGELNKKIRLARARLNVAEENYSKSVKADADLKFHRDNCRAILFSLVSDREKALEMKKKFLREVRGEK